MTKQIENLVTPFHLLSVDEQEQITTTVRYNKYVAKPSYTAIKKKATAKTNKATGTKVKNLLKGLSQDDLAKVLAALNKGQS